MYRENPVQYFGVKQTLASLLRAPTAIDTVLDI